MTYKSLSNLPTEELLSITLRESSTKTASQLLNYFSSLKDLATATESDLKSIKIGPAKAKLLLAALELGKRLYLSPPPEQKAVIKSPADVVNLLQGEMRLLDREHFIALLLNTKNEVIAKDTISIGSLNASLVHPRELFKNAIKRSAAALILVHNHPSGNPASSKQDEEITKRLTEAGKLLGIEILDHVIIGDPNYVSLKEQGII